MRERVLHDLVAGAVPKGVLLRDREEALRNGAVRASVDDVLHDACCVGMSGLEGLQVGAVAPECVGLRLVRSAESGILLPRDHELHVAEIAERLCALSDERKALSGDGFAQPGKHNFPQARPADGGVDGVRGDCRSVDTCGLRHCCLDVADGRAAVRAPCTCLSHLFCVFFG